MRIDKLINQWNEERQQKPNIPPEFWLKPVKVQREGLKEMGLASSLTVEWVETNEANNCDNP